MSQESPLIGWPHTVPTDHRRRNGRRLHNGSREALRLRVHKTPPWDPSVDNRTGIRDDDRMLQRILPQKGLWSHNPLLLRHGAMMVPVNAWSVRSVVDSPADEKLHVESHYGADFNTLKIRLRRLCCISLVDERVKGMRCFHKLMAICHHADPSRRCIQPVSETPPTPRNADRFVRVSTNGVCRPLRSNLMLDSVVDVRQHVLWKVTRHRHPWGSVYDEVSSSRISGVKNVIA